MGSRRGVAAKVTGEPPANGTYAEELREAFGESVLRSGVNYFVLSNAWAPVEPNGLSIQKDRVRYVEVKNGQRTTFDLSPDNCPQLSDAVGAFYEHLESVIPIAMGELAYGDAPYLDGPSYVIEIHGEKATVVIDPNGSRGANFPLVRAAETVKEAVRVCQPNQLAQGAA